MRISALLALISLPLMAADEARLALLLQAQTEFDRVGLAGVARLTDAGACVQSQAAALAAAAPSDASLLHYRKGFCLMAEAAVTRRPDQYGQAAEEFERAIEAWPQRVPPAKNLPVEPVSPGLRVLADIARLEEGSDSAAAARARSDLAAAAAATLCSSDVMPAPACQEVLKKGREWLGWMALERNDAAGYPGVVGIDLLEAARDFTGANDGWADWAAGREAFANRRYESAVQDYREATSRWDAYRRESPPTLLQAMTPQPDFAAALTDLGGAQLLAGDPQGAIATLNRAVHEDPSLARPLYLRARAKETAGDATGALADYSLASRAAFAAAKDLVSGEAHFYRGILLYRRKDPARAEAEFASALNFTIPTALRADAQAWRHLAAVANGACGSSRNYLEQSLATVSPYFPQAEARATAASCSSASARGAAGAPGE